MTAHDRRPEEQDGEVERALRRRFAPPAGLEARAQAFARAHGAGAHVGPSRAASRAAALAVGALLALAAAVLLLVELRPAKPGRESAPAEAAPPEVAQPRAVDPSAAWPVPACAVGPLADAPEGASPAVLRPDLESLYERARGWAESGVLACTGERWCSSEGSVCLKTDTALRLQGPFSSRDWPTATIWTGPPEQGSPVLVADLDTTHRCCLEVALPPDSPLHLFTWRVGGIVLTEITPVAEPRLFDCFESARAH